MTKDRVSVAPDVTLAVFDGDPGATLCIGWDVGGWHGSKDGLAALALPTAGEIVPVGDADRHGLGPVVASGAFGVDYLLGYLGLLRHEFRFARIVVGVDAPLGLPELFLATSAASLRAMPRIPRAPERVLESRLNYSDPFGLCPEWIDGKPCDLNAAASFAAGFGDAVTFGATNWVRDKMGTNDVVDKEGAAYFGGEVSGLVASTALGSATAGAIREGSTLATSGPVRGLATKALSTGAGRALFGKGGSLNAGRALRIGVSKGKDGRMVFRMAGEAIESAAGTKHIDLIDLGRITDYLKSIPK